MKQRGLALGLSAVALWLCGGVQGDPVKLWEAAHAGGSVYYGGGVREHCYYTGQISWGPQAWDTAGTRTGGTNIQHLVSTGSKCATPVGEHVFFTHGNGGGVFRIDSDWQGDFVTNAVNPGGTGPEALATDGTHLYGNDDNNQGLIHKYAIGNAAGIFTLTEVWCATTGLTRVRGLSYHEGAVYAVDAMGTNVVAVDAATGASTVLFSLPPPAGKVYYQAVRSGDRIYVVGNDNALRVYDTDGTNWTAAGVHALGTAGYGISDVDAGNVWISSSGKVCFWSLRELPFADDFESYPVGHSLADLAYSGWSGPTGAVVQAGVGEAGSQAAAWQGDASVDFAVAPSAALPKAWTDLRIKAARLGANPALDETASAMLYVNEAGYVVVYDPAAAEWVVCASNAVGDAVAALEEDAFARISLCQDYAAGTVAVFVNGELVREGVAMVAARPHYEALSICNYGDQGTLLDNLWISTNYPAGLDDDGDGDGWADAREIDEFGSIAAETNGVPCVWLADRGLSDPDGDADDDARTNGEEYLAGTDPTDDGSTFRILGIAQDGSGLVVTICGNDSGAPTPYVIERCSNLADGFEAYDTVARGTAPGNTVYSDDAPPAGAAFYRVKAVP